MVMIALRRAAETEKVGEEKGKVVLEIGVLLLPVLEKRKPC
jgi:hypothetical protein